jgi:biopolymer transport protein ExbB
MLAFFDFVMLGGIVMVPIVLCSVLALGIVCERFVNLRRKRFLPYELLSRIEMFLQEQKIPEADRSKPEIKEMIEEQGRQEVPVLERNLTTLGTIASISPFLGLLGTVVGLLKVFEAIAQAGGVTNAAVLSEGIHNALITTVGGLCVAIPALVAYNYFARKAEGLILEIERVSLRLLNILKR